MQKVLKLHKLVKIINLKNNKILTNDAFKSYFLHVNVEMS